MRGDRAANRANPGGFLAGFDGVRPHGIESCQRLFVVVKMTLQLIYYIHGYNLFDNFFLLLKNFEMVQKGKYLLVLLDLNINYPFVDYNLVF